MVNQLGMAQRVRILNLLLEGMSMRSICRVEDVSWRTVDKLLKDAAKVCRRHHNTAVCDIKARKVQCDELWSFCYMKQKRAKQTVGAPKGAGDVWTWTALEAQDKLLIAYRVGDRTDKTCRAFMKDLRSRITTVRHLDICTDGNASYVKAVRRYFGPAISYSQLVKEFSGKELTIQSRRVSGKHRMEKASTSYVERLNLTIRMSARRYTRKTNGFSKTLDNHRNTIDLFATYYNFIKIHQTLETTPAVEAGLAPYPYTLEWLVEMIDHHAPKPRRPETYRKRHEPA